MIPKIRVHAMVPLIITLCALLAGGARAQDAFGTLSGAHFDEGINVGWMWRMHGKSLTFSRRNTML